MRQPNPISELFRLITRLLTRRSQFPIGLSSEHPLLNEEQRKKLSTELNDNLPFNLRISLNYLENFIQEIFKSKENLTKLQIERKNVAENYLD